MADRCSYISLGSDSDDGRPKPGVKKAVKERLRALEKAGAVFKRNMYGKNKVSNKHKENDSERSGKPLLYIDVP